MLPYAKRHHVQIRITKCVHINFEHNGAKESSIPGRLE